jgi:hypothetical protein
MKLIFLLLIVAVSAVAQTNYIAAASNLREVDGQLYDVLRSQKWETVRCKYQNQSGELAVFRKVVRVKIGERPAPKPTEGDNLNSSGLIQSVGTMTSARVDLGIYRDEDGDFILLKNFPAAHVITGQEFSPRLIRVGETNFNGAVVALYDCGTPHMVPVIKPVK